MGKEALAVDIPTTISAMIRPCVCLLERPTQWKIHPDVTVSSHQQGQASKTWVTEGESGGEAQAP